MSSQIIIIKTKNVIHEVLSETDLSCTLCGMSRYDQLQNKKSLTKQEEKELKDCINQKHWGLID